MLSLESVHSFELDFSYSHNANRQQEGNNVPYDAKRLVDLLGSSVATKIRNKGTHVVGHVGGTTGWASGFGFWLRSWFQDPKIKPYFGFHAQCTVCLGSSLPLPLPPQPLHPRLVFSQTKQTRIVPLWTTTAHGTLESRTESEEHPKNTARPIYKPYFNRLTYSKALSD